MSEVLLCEALVKRVVLESVKLTGRQLLTATVHNTPLCCLRYKTPLSVPCRGSALGFPETPCRGSALGFPETSTLNPKP